MYVLEWRIVSALTRGLFWCLFPELRSNEGNKYQNNTRMSTEMVRHESTYIILFLTRHNESINDYKKKSFTHRPHVSRAWFSFCWWRHNRLLMMSQWPDNCDAITWIMISNSLDIDYIHGDIHGQSCKKCARHALVSRSKGKMSRWKGPLQVFVISILLVSNYSLTVFLRQQTMSCMEFI